MPETRERAAIRLANQAAFLANALTGGPLHETATAHERAQLWDALEGWRKASGIPGDGWPIREDAVLRATPEIDVYWWCPECREVVDASRVTYQELHDTCGTRVEARATPASDGGEVRERWRGWLGAAAEIGRESDAGYHEIACDVLNYIDRDDPTLLSGAGTPQGEVVPAPMRWNQAEGRDGERYTAGWNACRDAMLAALRSGAQGEDELAALVVRRELEEARERERALRDDLTAAIGHLSALVDMLHHDGYPEHSDRAARLVSAAEIYLESPSLEQEVGAATPQGEGEVVTQAEIEARWLEYVAARESLVSAAFNAGSCASLHGGVHRDDIDRQGCARDRLDAAVRTLAALLRSKAEDRATPTDRSEPS